jgi:hypothetical protein
MKRHELTAVAVLSVATDWWFHPCQQVVRIRLTLSHRGDGARVLVFLLLVCTLKYYSSGYDLSRGIFSYQSTYLIEVS